jgi:serine/threonine-protein kinase
VERVILRCLEKLPEDRPASALAIAAALPGGDPLAAALAAGEIPSPEMVAASGSATNEVSTRYLWALVPLVLGLLVMAGLAKWQLESRVPLDKPPAVLVDRAHELAQSFSGGAVLRDTDWGFLQDRDYLRHIDTTDSSLHRWERLERADSPAMYLWHRTSPRDLDPAEFSGEVGWNDPSFNLSNMTRMLLNPEGRLRQYERIAPQREDSSWTAAGDVDYGPFFVAAGFDPETFTSTAPLWNPEVYCDSRAAWEGNWVDGDTLTVRIEAGAYRGEPVYWETIWPWTAARRMEPPPVGGDNRVIFFVSIGLFVSLIAGSVILARQNIKHGKGDRRGATRLALVMYLAHMIRWLLAADHIMSAQELGLFFAASGFALVQAALVWLVYMALEPYLRRHAPDTLISWVRVLKGRFNDRRVARDTLIGMTGSVVLDALENVAYVANRWMGLPLEIPPSMTADFLTSPRHALAVIFNCVGNGPMNGLLIVLIFTVMLMMSRRGMRIGAGVVVLGGAAMLPFEEARMVGFAFMLGAVVVALLSFLTRFRRGVAGMVVFIFALGAAQVHGLIGNVVLALILGALFAIVLMTIMVRYGVWAYIVNAFFNILFSVAHLRFETDSWFSYVSIMLWVLVALVAAWSVRAILRQRPPGYAT